MNKLRSNIIYNLSYQILILILPLITAPYISRVLGVDGIGTYSYVFSVSYYFYIAITQGLTNYGNRSIAKVRGDREKVSTTFWSIYFMQLCTGSIVLIIYFIYTFFIVEPKFRLFFITFIPYILAGIMDINWFYFGLTEFKFTTIRNTIVHAISMIFIFGFVKTPDDLKVYFLIMGITYLFSNGILWTRVKKHVDWYFPSLEEIVVHIKPNLILFIPILAISIYRVMDKIMIKELSSITENGYYEYADKIITMGITAFSAVATVMMPSVSSMVAQGKKEETKDLLRDTMQISMFLGFGIMFGLTAVGRVFAPLFFGNQFKETGVLIQFLSITVIMSGWKSVIRSQYIIPYEKDKAYVISLVTGAIINVICNYYFIPLYHARGAVIGTVVAELAGLIIQTGVTSKEVNIWILIKEGLIFAIPGIIMAIIVMAFLQLTVQSILSLCCAILIGIVVYVVLGGLIIWIFEKDRFRYYRGLIFGQKGRG